MSDSEILDYLLKSGYFEIGAESGFFRCIWRDNSGSPYFQDGTFSSAREAVEAAINEDFYGVRTS